MKVSTIIVGGVAVAGAIVAGYCYDRIVALETRVENLESLIAEEEVQETFGESMSDEPASAEADGEESEEVK